MKIICLARNYAKHAKELNNPLPEKPVFFMKPDSAIIQNGKPFYLPEFSQDVHHEVELILKINRLGKKIDKKFAHRYYDEIGIGIDFTARDIQKTCKEKGLPWEIAKGFDGSAVLGDFMSISNIPEVNNINFNLKINDNEVQVGSTRDLIFSFDTIISYISQFVTLKIGDLIYTGTPEGVGPVQIGDHLEGAIERKKMLDFWVK